MSKYLRFCQRCHDEHRIDLGYTWTKAEDNYTCGVCGGKLIDLPLTVEEFNALIIQKYIKWELYDQEVERLIKLKEEDPILLDTQVYNQKEKRKRESDVQCPYCGSNYTKKISVGRRLFSVGTFGLASGKVGKQWHCNNCKSDF